MNEKNKGVIMILLSSLFFAMMATTVKYAADYSLAEKVFFRNFVGLIVMSVMMVRHKVSFKPNHLPLLTVRSLLGLTGVFLYFIAIGNLDLSISVTLNKTSPFFVMIFASLFLKEHFTKHKVTSLFIAILGVLIIMRPSGEFNPLYGLIGLGSAIAAGGAYTAVRKLKDHDHPLVIIFYFCLYSVIISGPIAFSTGLHIASATDLGILTLIGIFAVIAQTFMTFAYRHAPASELAIYTYMNIVFSSIIGLIFYKEEIGLMNFTGIALIIFAGYINYRGRSIAT